MEDVEEIVESDIANGTVVERLLYVEPGKGEKVVKQDEINFYKKQRRVALHGCGTIDPENIDEAMGVGAFKGLKRALSMSPKEVVDEVLESGLRGRGGGGFPAGRKWMFAQGSAGDEKYVVCNGDEGDPGAFMDRSILEGNPLGVIEGMMIAGYAIGAQNGYFYVRAEYPIAVNRLKLAIKQAREMGLLGDNIMGTGFSFDCHIRLGAGAFVCGEETALLNSIEGKRGMPRPRPPFPAVKGLWGKPTIVNNVESLACVPFILREGADEFAKVGTEGSKGTKVFALGGKVNNVGLVEVPMGTTLRELIYDIGGGIPNGKKFKAIQTGGPSGGCLTEEFLDEPIDFDNLVQKGSMMGSGGAIVMDEDNCMVDVAKFYMEFICDESCGKCSPCRIGTKRILEILTKITEGKGTMEDLDTLEELSKTIQKNSLCALGQTAANPVNSTLKHFRDEYIAHIVDKKCPAHVCKSLMQYKIDKDKCIGCGLCARNCPASCIEKTDYVAEGHKLPSMQIDPEKCVKCGLCMSNCKFAAISKE
jgi:NADH:ubiquinone oxidoreductase subunit F (NADH-binding)/ferredoxin